MDFLFDTDTLQKNDNTFMYPQDNNQANPKELEMKLNGWRAPNYRPTALIRELKYAVNAKKGTAIEQSFLYIDSTSVDDWLALSSRDDYDYIKAESEAMPLTSMANLICHYLDDSKFIKDEINIMALGCGDGKKEELLIRNLLWQKNFKKIRCQLVDISTSLAMEAHDRLSNTFENFKNQVEVSFHTCNFLELPHYNELLETNPSVLRVACMFGGTFGNLTSELHFLRHSLNVLNLGDLFLLDAVLTFAPITEPHKIHELDPRLRGIWQEATEKWIRGPIERYREDAGQISFKNILKIGASAFRNSYTVEMQAFVTHKKTNEEVKFTLLQLHRYDPESFIQTFEEEKWKNLGGEQYGIQNKRLVYLFAKQEPPSIQ